MPDIDLKALWMSLYARCEEAVVVPHEPRTMTSGPPTEHECHNNVDRWVLEHPDHKPVRGWLVFNLLCRFTAHSVVETPDGRLFDLTPARASQRYPFLRHRGPDDEFEAIVRAGFIHLDLRA
jgi:hypothetical protein